MHVAAAAIFDAQGRVLIARRPEHVHQGGLWEFPGGKLEADETVEVALRRELREEVGIEIVSARPLIRVRYDYPDKAVLLDVWRVDAFQGDAHGRERQPLVWVSPEDLSGYEFPQANKPIIRAVRLPDRYLITPEPNGDQQVFLDSLSAALLRGVRLVQLRAKQLPLNDYIQLAREVCRLCHIQGARLLLNAVPEVAMEAGADGVHLTSQRLLALSQRPLSKGLWVAASCHSLEELQHAAAIDVDFAVLGPVHKTSSHPESLGMGWEGFHALTDRVGFPVYALGGMHVEDVEQAHIHGAQGIAAISGLWVQ